MLLQDKIKKTGGLEELQATVRDALLAYGTNRVLYQAVAEARACRYRLRQKIEAAKVDIKLPISIEGIEKEIDLFFTVTDLQHKYNKIKQVERLSLLPRYRKDLKELEKQVKKMEKELKIICPFCKKEFTVGS